jgi:hypothetical protein
MKTQAPPQLIPSEDLPAHFLSHGIQFKKNAALELNFGHGNDQYRLYRYPGPTHDETMGIFFEWHTMDFFAVDSGPHLGIGLRGPVEEDPHRGRGLAIGILASHMNNPEDSEHPVQLFKGCPGPPGGPSFFIEDFSKNDGIAAIPEWQLSLGQQLPALKANQVYRIDIHVSSGHVWAAVWQITNGPMTNGVSERSYTFLAQTTCSENALGFSGDITAPCPQTTTDRGRGNAFIGTAFADPETRSRVDNIHIAHWRGSFPRCKKPLLRPMRLLNR